MKRLLVTMVLTLSSAIPGLAQSPQWGTVSHTVATVNADTFQSVEGFPILAYLGSSFWYKIDDKQIVASFPALPNGALITSVQLEGCDHSASDAIVFHPAYLTADAMTPLTPSSMTTGFVGIPGCGVFTLPLPQPHQVNSSNAYVLILHTFGTNAARFSAARVFYKLQVSPAPATTSFDDVPVGSPLHKFVEALVSAGITRGCGARTFCPDAPVSRAQLAVYMAVALGLSFQNQ